MEPRNVRMTPNRPPSHSSRPAHAKSVWSMGAGVLIGLCGLSAGALGVEPAPSSPAPSAPSERPKADPSRDETLSNPSIEDAIAEQRKGRGDRVPVKPVAKGREDARAPELGAPEASPAGGARELWNSPAQWKGRTVPEGAFLAAREGAIVRTRSGDAAFVPVRVADTTDAEREAPMVVLPNQRLAQLDAALGTGSEARRVTASGQVFSYRGRAYLSLTAFSLTKPSSATGDAKPAESATKAPPGTAPNAASPAPGAEPDDQRVREMLAELEERRGMPRALDASNLALPSEAVKGLKAPEHVLAEGTVLTRRRARLVRGAVGAVLAFDNDPNSPGLGAMPILPCRMLEHMENVAAQHGEDLVFVVSGRVSTYQSRNYVLPTMYQVVRPSDLSSAQ